MGVAFKSGYKIDEVSVKISHGILDANIVKVVGEENVVFPLKLYFLKSGVVRVYIDELSRQQGKIEITNNLLSKQRYAGSADYVLVGGLEIDKSVSSYERIDNDKIVVKFGPKLSFKVILELSTVKLEFQRDGETQVILNERRFLEIEHWRSKPTEENSSDNKDLNPREIGQWEEKFGGSTDSKPFGPESIGLDITFIGYENVYGIPEHATSLSLKETRGDGKSYEDPYRLYNFDVFEYVADSSMALYGAIPFMQAHKVNSDVAIFWLNPSETWIDILKTKSNPSTFSTETSSTMTHWFSESGVLDLFVFLGPDASTIYKKYGELVGYTAMPQFFALGHHQCRWNYINEADVANVHAKFDEYDIPFDVLWLDIEYTEGKKYFTWDSNNFPDPMNVIQGLSSKGRKLVVIIDPHIKVEDNYWVYDEVKSKDLSVQKVDGSRYNAWCWPGNSLWLDFFNPKAYKWWEKAFSNSKFKSISDDLYIWNDMNEPSVFNGPEITMQKDNIHHGGWEHRAIHNLYGLLFHNSTSEGLIQRSKGTKRPFVLTRSFFAGSQRSSAHWTGDNIGDWEHMSGSAAMLLSNGLAGFSFGGADVGGFFGNPSQEMLVRWYQAGAFYPFFRAHAHIDTKRREPWLVGEPYTAMIRDSIRLRYSLLPVWYTAFHRSSIDGMPVLRPNFITFPADVDGFTIDDQYFLGDSGLLVKPVVSQGAENVAIYLADDQPHYDYYHYNVFKGKGHHEYYAPLDKLPLLIRGGHIVTRRDRIRRAAPLTLNDPFTFVVALNNDGNAEGSLYLDDGESYDYMNGKFSWQKYVFDLSKGIFYGKNMMEKSKGDSDFIQEIKSVRIEKIIVLGVPEDFGVEKRMLAMSDGMETKLDYTFVKGLNTKPSYIVIRDPKLMIYNEWQITF